jgi:hypothetical protein
MKLYAWQPKGHGEYSFFVCAESEQEAKNAVDAHIKKHLNQQDNEYIGDYEIGGWGTDYYRLTVVRPLSVVTNSND